MGIGIIWNYTNTHYGDGGRHIGTMSQKNKKNLAEKRFAISGIFQAFHAESLIGFRLKTG